MLILEMMKRLVVPLVCGALAVGFGFAPAMLAGGSALTVAATTDDEPELKLKRPRTRFLRQRMPNERRRPALSIRITGEILNLDKAEDPEEYYCLEEVWIWDDDTESEYAPDCDPYEEGAELKRFFSATHQFRSPGSYQVRLRLERNGDTILSGTTIVDIRS